VLDPNEQDELEEFELLEFELLDYTILQEELDGQSPPVLPSVQSYRPLKRKRYARVKASSKPELASIAEVHEDV
jgi:hypothetical protein